MYDVPDLVDILCSDYSIPHTTTTVGTQKFGVVDGQIISSMSFTERSISITFIGKAKNEWLQKMINNALEKYFSNTNGKFWICFGNTPYKKYHVVYQSMTENYNTFPFFQSTINLIDYDGVAESVVSSLDARKFAVNGWALGMNMPFDEDTSYIFENEKSFSVFNPSDIVIDPLYKRHNLQVQVQGTGAFTLTNLTNGTSVTCNALLSSSDTFLMVKTSPFINGIRSGVKTDNGYISLDKGWNDFKISSINNPIVTFSFPFYYLT